MPRQGWVVREYAIIANQAIMGNMTIRHYETIFTNYGLHAVWCTLVDCGTFPNRCIVTNDNRCFLSVIFKILWRCRDNGTGENIAILPYPSAFHDSNIWTYPGAISNYDIIMYSSEWFYNHIFSNFCTRVYVGKRLIHISSFLQFGPSSPLRRPIYHWRRHKPACGKYPF